MGDLVLVYSPAAVEKFIQQAEGAGALAGQFRLYSRVIMHDYRIQNFTHAVPGNEDVGAILERDDHARIVAYAPYELELRQNARDVFYTPENAQNARRSDAAWRHEYNTQQAMRFFINMLKAVGECELK